MRSAQWPLIVGGVVALTASPTAGKRSAAPPGNGGRSSIVDHRALSPVKTGRSLYQQAITRLLAQKRFELSEILHYGVRSQPERYHLRVRVIAPDRLRQERDDMPGITVQVGGVACSGPRRWHCQHRPFPALWSTIRGFLLPTSREMQSHLTGFAYQSASPTRIVIHARGDAWRCPPSAQGCDLPGSSWQQGTRYTAILVLDPHSHLPLSWTSWVAPPTGPASPRQTIRFSFQNDFSISLPHYPAWKCPWWDPPGTWCMKEPGA